LYRVVVLPSAARSLGRLPRNDIRRIAQVLDNQVLDNLQVDPRPSGVVKLTGEGDKYRVRVGRYRILYIIRDEILTVTVVAIGHRRDVYRRRSR
jgi:mRNA interferase RelE/StbE